MKEMIPERKVTIGQAQQEYGDRSKNPRLTEAFYDFLDTYDPRGTPSRLQEMFLYWLRGLARHGEENTGNFYDLSEDLIALKILFDRIDQELIPLPTQYITVKEKKDLKAKSGTQAKKTNEGNIGSEG